jgi:NTP pyrophosphatase (non-canonical NTP hydrolase)
MEPKIKEILDILKEECGELVVAASKCTRWGLEGTWEGRYNLDNLSQEAADVMCMIQLLVDNGVLNPAQLVRGQESKVEKLKKWSNIFKDAP